MHDENFIKLELAAFTGLSLETVQEYLDRKVYPCHRQEFPFWHPKNDADMRWFYAASRSYLFANAIHVLPVPLAREILVGLEKIHSGRVLDFGGGTGNFSFTLAQRDFGCDVTYFDIGIIQCQFVRFVANRHSLNIRVIQGQADYNWEFPHWNQVTHAVHNGLMGAILALDVLEHIPDYPKYIERMSGEWLQLGGRMYVRAPFGYGDPTHLADSHNILRVMQDNNLYLEKTVSGVEIWVKDK
jgi:2-polyprenyl-3-methyl-5-hydroxy-6-metoxy-1,4-benzoquinol methylase